MTIRSPPQSLNHAGGVTYSPGQHTAIGYDTNDSFCMSLNKEIVLFFAIFFHSVQVLIEKTDNNRLG